MVKKFSLDLTMQDVVALLTPLKYCDFCSSTAVRWRYAPGWLACDECSAIIETEDKIGLFTKTLETFKEKVLGGKNWASMDTTERKEIATGIEYVHGHFWNEAVSGRQEVKA